MAVLKHEGSIMVSLDDFGHFETAWCPGCGNHAILAAVKEAMVAAQLAPHQLLLVSGIGQAAKAPHYLRANVFNGLHGRALPVATGARLANHGLKVVVESGDGCNYGEGGNHFLAAIRRNIDVTLLVHNNQIYGLTKGQASPTTAAGFVTKAQPDGVFSEPHNPIAVAVALRAGFVARSFSGAKEHLVATIVAALQHPGFSLVDILHPCVSFNNVNTFAWYKERCRPLSEEHDPSDWEAAMRIARKWGDEIPIGIIYRDQRIRFEDHVPTLMAGPLVEQKADRRALREFMMSFA